MRGVLSRVLPTWHQTRTLLIAIVLLVLVFFFFFWRLVSMTPGLSPTEFTSIHDSQDIKQVINQGVNAPYHLAQYGLMAIFDNNLLAARLASIAIFLIIAVFLFLLLRSWFGQTVALFATLIFFSTPWIIITARTATPNIMFLWSIVPLASFILMKRSKRRAGMWWIAVCLTSAISFYVPGTIWFLIAFLVILSRLMLSTFNRINRAYLISGMVVGILLIVPLLLAIAIEPSHISQLLLIPNRWQSLVGNLKSIGWSAVSFFWQTRSIIDIGVDHLPILDILQIVLMIFGIYALSSRARDITLSIGGLWLLSIIISGINNDSHYLLIGLPVIAVFMGAGLRYLYIEWRKIFPFNPFAYGLAISLITIVVCSQLLYTGRYSLIAWPHANETKATYVLK